MKLIKCVTIIILFPALILAQTISDSISGYWKENEELMFEYDIFNNYTKDFDRYKPTTSENSDIQKKILLITDLFKRNMALNPPLGSAVYFYGDGGTELELASVASPKAVRITLQERRLFRDCDTCRIILATEAFPLLTITFNYLQSFLTQALYKNNVNKNPAPLNDRWFISPNLQEKIQGFPAEITEEADFVILTKINRPFGIPVTQEEYLTEAIKVTKRDYLETEKNLSSSTLISAQKELDDIDREMQNSIREMERVDPNTARTMREEFEKQKKETLANLRAVENDNAKEKQEGLKNYRFILDQLESELESLSYQEKVSPAFYKHWGYAEDDSTGQKLLLLNKDKSERISGLVDKGGFPVVKFNPRFFNTILRSTDIQIMVVKINRLYRSLSANEYLDKLINKICENLDFCSLFEMVK